MTKSCNGILIVGLVLLMAACAPMTPAPSGEVISRPTETLPPPPQKPTPESRPSIPEKPPARLPSTAVQSLLDQGWSRYHRKDYEGALGVADRAQRIDARSPQVYLLMASAQLGLYRNAAAEQLVRKGLAFSAPGTRVNQQLQALLGKIMSGGE